MTQKMPFPAATCAASGPAPGAQLRLCLYQPDIPQNAGSLMRLCACLGLAMDVIEPCGFLFSDRNLRRAGMDYRAGVDLTRHASWQAYQAGRTGRLVLLTTKAADPYASFVFRPGDTILVGRESAGVPDEVHAAADARLIIPMRPGMRSLNMAQAAAMVLGEALRQTSSFPEVGSDGQGKCGGDSDSSTTSAVSRPAARPKDKSCT